VFLPLILVAATGVMLLLYHRNKDSGELTPKQRNVLMALRFISFAVIAFLLLSPFLKTLKKNLQHPLIIAAWDNSGSVVVAGDSLKAAENIEQLKKRISEELGQEYRLINYSFGQETVLEGELTFSEKKSDYSKLFTSITGNHFNEKIGAVILAGDGIYNQGKNPVNMTGDINFPVFSIGLGDTTEVTDARIQGLRVNRTSFSGNRFPVEIDAAFSRLQGIPLKLTIKHEGEEVVQTVISTPNNDYFISHQFILDAGEPGLKKFTAEIEVAENEKNIRNNQVTFIVNVLENKQKIVVLSNGPHPDIGAIRYTLEQQESYEVEIFNTEPYPSNLSDFNLIILHQLPTTGKSMADILEKVKLAKIPVLYITGTKTYIPQFNTLATGAEIQPLAGLPQETQAIINPSYATFTLSEQFREILPQFPPLMAPFANYTLDGSLSPLLSQKIKNVETAKPLLATGVVNGIKTGFLFGEGIWRWRLNNYLLNQTHDQFNELINQLVQYLALRENEDNFMIDFEPVYAETDDVIMTAEVYNDAFEVITSEEVTIEIVNELGDTYDFTFDVRGNGYYLNAGNLPVGNYRFSAEVILGEQIYTESGNFVITEMNLENVVTRANHRMMYQLATQSGGRFFSGSQADEVINVLQETNYLKPLSSIEEMITELLNLRWLFFVLILLLSVEWFLRKYWGIY
jgi:hypothetical protein